MKLVKEHINEKFIEDSDPIRDMGIGLIDKIKKWLKAHYIKGYIINNDLSIDVKEFQVDFANTDSFGNFPDFIQFNYVEYDFKIGRNIEMTSLKGCPKVVGGDFDCMNTSITNLVGGPIHVMGDYICSSNSNLYSLDGIAKLIDGGLYCRHMSHKIFTIKDIPKYAKIKGKLRFSTRD